MGKTSRAVLVVIAATAVAVLGFGSAASAHVTIQGGPAQAGGDARIAFLVPTESDTASTTKLEVAFPTDKPVPSVATTPVAGWSVAVETTKLSTPIKSDDGEVNEVVSTVTWRANSPDTAIKPGQFLEFPVALGSLPDTDRLVFKVLQTYSDGSVVRWIDEPTTNGTEPEHPAPVLTLTKSGADASPAAAPVAVKYATDRAARKFALGGAVLGLLGWAFGAVALFRTRRPAPPAA